MERMQLEFKEQDQCFKDYLKMFQETNLEYFTFFMHNLKNNMDYILIQ